MAADTRSNGSLAPLSDVVTCYEFPVAVWDTRSMKIVMVNDKAADLVGSSADEAAGRPAGDFIEITKGAAAAANALRSGAIDDLRAHRTLKRRGNPDVPVHVWTKTVTVDDRRFALTAVVTDTDLPLLESDPTLPWRELFRTALGFLDHSGRIQSVSTEIRAVLGGKPEEWIGTRLADVVRPEDAGFVDHAFRSPPQARMTIHVTLRQSAGGGRTAWLTIGRAPDEPGAAAAFALGAYCDQPANGERDRIADLELRLRRIGAEVRAAGMLDVVVRHPPAEQYFPILAELSTRQWEILTRLRRGDRAPTIAAELYLSPSTVRNHLTQIFRKFGVHSQAELLAVLHSGAGDTG